MFQVWDLRRKGNEPIFSIKGMEDYVSAMITNRDAKYLVCASGDGSLTTLNIPERKMHLQVFYNLHYCHFVQYQFVDIDSFCTVCSLRNMMKN